MSNLPPGVTDSMIPGNSPEDQEEQAMGDAIYDGLEPHLARMIGKALAEKVLEDRELFDTIFDLLGLAWRQGYDDGQADAALAQAAREAGYLEGGGEKQEMKTRIGHRSPKGTKAWENNSGDGIRDYLVAARDNLLDGLGRKRIRASVEEALERINLAIDEGDATFNPED